MQGSIVTQQPIRKTNIVSPEVITVIPISPSAENPNGDCFGPCCASFLLSTILTPFAAFCLVPCYKLPNQRGGIFIGCTISSLLTSIVFFVVGMNL